MPLVGYINPLTLEKVPHDYFDTDTTLNGRPACPPWQARMCWEKSKEDIRHQGIALTATGATGCPREVFLKANFDYYDRLDFRYPMDRGTAMHAVSGRFWPKNYISEESASKAHRPFLTLNGTLFGVQQSCLIDTLRLERTPEPGENPLDIRVVEILDSKFPADGSVRWRGMQGGMAKPEYAVQLNQARLLLAQQEWALKAGYDPDDVMLTIWDHAYQSGAPPEPQAAPHMSEAEMLEVRPWGGAYSVRTIIAINSAMNMEYDALSAAERKMPSKVRELASRIPLVGETHFGGKQQKKGVKCKSCAVKDLCDTLVHEHGEPATLA